MYVKYQGSGSTQWVALFGPLHGAAFIAYAIVCIVAAQRLRWPFWAFLLAFFAAIPPLLTLPAEWLLKRRGLLAHPAMR